MKTNFELVSEMNTAFGNPKGDPTNIDWTKVQKQCLNIPDEVGELFAALGGHAKGTAAHNAIVLAVNEFKNVLANSLRVASDGPDLHGVRDALCDIPVFTYGAQHWMGIDGDRDMRSVVAGVMTRFIKDDADLEATIATHAAKGISEVYFEGEFPTLIMKSAVDQPDAPAGKFLKSASYRDAVFYDVRNPNWCAGCEPDTCSGCVSAEGERSDATTDSAGDKSFSFAETGDASGNTDFDFDAPAQETGELSPTQSLDGTPEHDSSEEEEDDTCYECDKSLEDCECGEDL
jgi:predicted HAD superfamily Cof-like phosphohydrolase